jgi:predicted nucleic-acid-binding Zn-ribbon protein
MKQLKKPKDLKNIPENIGYDPYWGYLVLCRNCGSKRYLFGNMVSHEELRRINKSKGKRYKEACKGCGSSEIYYERKLDEREAYHKNDIRWRGTTLNKTAAYNK